DEVSEQPFEHLRPALLTRSCCDSRLKRPNHLLVALSGETDRVSRVCGRDRQVVVRDLAKGVSLFGGEARRILSTATHHGSEVVGGAFQLTPEQLPHEIPEVVPLNT